MNRKELSAWEYKNCHKTFHSMIEWLEKFIEIFYKKEFPDWENWKQVRNSSIIRKDIYQYPEHARSAFSAMVHLFALELEDYLSDHPFLEKEFKQEFYRWINATGLTAENCPNFLRSLIFEINQVLGGNFAKIRSDKANRKREIETDDPKYLEGLNELFGKINKNNFKEKEN
ncbi:MAG: hypothetical protein I3273_07935, partial [Candidatus Moeniiplasma glomeromycotorum]|nr:hypothetical protein [Candidatus Moeniiplasma glomeromycotorum]